jgi:hypothetical protein
MMSKPLLGGSGNTRQIRGHVGLEFRCRRADDRLLDRRAGQPGGIGGAQRDVTGSDGSQLQKHASTRTSGASGLFLLLVTDLDRHRRGMKFVWADGRSYDANGYSLLDLRRIHRGSSLHEFRARIAENIQRRTSRRESAGLFGMNRENESAGSHRRDRSANTGGVSPASSCGISHSGSKQNAENDEQDFQLLRFHGRTSGSRS